MGSQGRYCSSARSHRGGVGSMAARLPEGRVYSEIGGTREGVVVRHGARIAKGWLGRTKVWPRFARM